MRTWRSGDATSLAAILSGTLLGTWIVPVALARLAPSPDPAAPTPTISVASVTETATLVRTETHRTTPVGRSFEGVAFQASSLDEGWVIEGDYGGRLARHGDDLTLEMPVAHLRALAYVDGAPHLRGIRLALGRYTEGSWETTYQGPLYRLDRDLDPGEDLWLSDVTLTLPDLPESELVDRWLVIVHEIEGQHTAGPSVTWTYAHADASVLARLMGWIESGC